MFYRRSASSWQPSTPPRPPNHPSTKTNKDRQINEFLLDVASENVPRANQPIHHPLYFPCDPFPDSLQRRRNDQHDQDERIARRLHQNMVTEAAQRCQGPPRPNYVPPQLPVQNQAHLLNVHAYLQQQQVKRLLHLSL